MPRGVYDREAVKRRNLPDRVRCDFCSEAFPPVAWNQRTCHRCAAIGCPDQSKPDYEKHLDAYRLQRDQRAGLNSRRASAKRTADARAAQGLGLAARCP